MRGQFVDSLQPRPRIFPFPGDFGQRPGSTVMVDVVVRVRLSRAANGIGISAIHRRDRSFAIFPGGSPSVHGCDASRDRALHVNPTSSRGCRR